MKKLRYAMTMLTMVITSTFISNANTVFIGDSRTVGIYDTLHGTSTANSTNINVTDPDGTTWSCKVGMGLKWMKETGVPQVESKIGEDTDVVILMGVNDVADSWSVNNYVTYLNMKGAEWTGKGADVYYVSIMPIKSDTKYISNSGINIWNETIKSQLDNVDYIEMKDSGIGYSFRDTYHFKNNTSLEIYDYLINTV